MHDLIALGPALPGALTTAEIDATMAYAEAEKALATRAAYASDWKDFSIWCHVRGATPLPAHVGIVGAYLSWLADSGRKSSTIGRRAAAIAYHHKMAGHEPPTSQEGVRAVLRGIRRTIGAAWGGKAPATADVLKQMLALCPDTLIGKRDRALLALGFAGAFPPLRVGGAAGGGSGRDPGRPTGRNPPQQDRPGRAGAEVAILRGCRLRPVEAVQSWLEAATITEGPVFREVKKGGRVQAVPLSAFSAAQLVKAYAERAGLDPAAYAGHSLRSGFLTGAAESGASVLKMMEVSQHKSVDTLRGNVRRADLFHEHAGAAFL